MNIRDAILSVQPDLRVFERPPAPIPAGPYVIVSELTDGLQKEYFRQENGYTPQERTLTLLLTLYGVEGGKQDALRDTLTDLKRLSRLVTEHAGLPTLRGVRLGLVLPVTHDAASKRAWAGLRYHLTYLEAT